MAVAVVVIVVGVAVVMVVAVVVAVVMAAVMAPGKGSGENLKKSSLRREERLFSGFLMRDGARIEVVGIPIDILPA